MSQLSRSKNNQANKAAVPSQATRTSNNDANTAIAVSVWTIIVAAGSGSRFGGEVPKQFIEINGKQILVWSLETALEVSEGVVVVLPQKNKNLDELVQVFEASIPMSSSIVVSVEGGATRSESVRRGLAAIPDDCEVVLVHDAARPLASTKLYKRVIEAVVNGAQAAVPVTAVIDTVCTTGGETLDREKLRIVQTPQGFETRALLEAHRDSPEATDDAGLISAGGGQVQQVEGERWNFKLTEQADEALFQVLLAR